MLEKILSLIEKKGISANKLLTECKLSTNSINAWKNGKAKPSLEAITKIADYFGVSVDYFLGKEKPNNPPPVATGISIARGGEVYHYTLNEEQLKHIQDLAEMLKKDEKQSDGRK